MEASSSDMLSIVNAHVPAAVTDAPNSGALRHVDIDIDHGTITAIRPAGGATTGGVIDADGGLVLPCPADIHTHLDKGHTWPRRQNPDGTWIGALSAVRADREAHWSAADIERRMDFSLRCAFVHGTAAIRTHLDSAPPQHEITWDVFSAMRERWAGRVELQGVSLVGPDTCLDPVALDSVARVVKSAGGILGGSIAVHPAARRAVFSAVEKAGELGLDLDLHIDETLDPESSALRHYADAVIESGFMGRTVAGHCCVLSVVDEHTVRATIERVAEAGISVVSLPMCNLYLQDRDMGRTPRFRGATLVNELRAAGVPVAIASDNTRDPFYAYGDLDMIEVFREGARIGHFDHPQNDAWTWVRSVSAGAAEIAGFDHRARIEVEVPADFILFRARNWTELHARPQADRRVFRGGVEIAPGLPDYRELDDLMEA